MKNTKGTENYCCRICSQCFKAREELIAHLEIPLCVNDTDLWTKFCRSCKKSKKLECSHWNAFLEHVKECAKRDCTHQDRTQALSRDKNSNVSPVQRPQSRAQPRWSIAKNRVTHKCRVCSVKFSTRKELCKHIRKLGCLGHHDLGGKICRSCDSEDFKSLSYPQFVRHVKRCARLTSKLRKCSVMVTKLGSEENESTDNPPEYIEISPTLLKPRAALRTSTRKIIRSSGAHSQATAASLLQRSLTSTVSGVTGKKRSKRGHAVAPQITAEPLPVDTSSTSQTLQVTPAPSNITDVGSPTQLKSIADLLQTAKEPTLSPPVSFQDESQLPRHPPPASVNEPRFLPLMKIRRSSSLPPQLSRLQNHFSTIRQDQPAAERNPQISDTLAPPPIGNEESQAAAISSAQPGSSGIVDGRSKNSENCHTDSTDNRKPNLPEKSKTKYQERRGFQSTEKPSSSYEMQVYSLSRQEQNSWSFKERHTSNLDKFGSSYFGEKRYGNSRKKQHYHAELRESSYRGKWYVNSSAKGHSNQWRNNSLSHYHGPVRDAFPANSRPSFYDRSTAYSRTHHPHLPSQFQTPDAPVRQFSNEVPQHMNFAPRHPPVRGQQHRPDYPHSIQQHDKEPVYKVRRF